MNRKRWKTLRFLRKNLKWVAGGWQKAAALAVSFAFAMTPAVPVLFPAAAEAKALPAMPQNQAKSGGCQLNSPQGKVQHVVTIIFDNTHFKRDPARDGSTFVPSDLEQMPHLLSFIKGNGVLLAIITRS